LEKIIAPYHRLSVFLGNCSVFVKQAEFLLSIRILHRNQPAQLPDLGSKVKRFMLDEGRSIFSRIADAIESDFRAIARSEQIEPDGDYSIWIFCGGRGAGKTFSGAQTVRDWIESWRRKRVGLIAPTAADARDVMTEGPSGILSVCPDSNRPTYEPTKRRIVWPNGATATLFLAEEPDRLRGQKLSAAMREPVSVDKS
jgi:phage terminase large subunit-like protein